MHMLLSSRDPVYRQTAAALVAAPECRFGAIPIDEGEGPEASPAGATGRFGSIPIEEDE